MSELIIFDCDGVLVDSERLIHEVLCEMLAELGIGITFEDAVSQFMGTSRQVCLERLAQVMGAPPSQDFLGRFNERSLISFKNNLIAVPGVLSLIETLRLPFCVASNGDRDKVLFTLGHTGLLPHFTDRIFTAEEVEKPKPAPDLFLHAAKKLGVPPHQTIVIEDTTTGVLAGKAAGMQVIGFAAMTPPAHLLEAGANVVARSMKEVQKLLCDNAGSHKVH